MKLYHGSNILIEEIDLSKTKPYKDFGQGFYLSDNIAQARQMAAQRVLTSGEGLASVTTYEFDEKLLRDSSLRVKIFKSYSMEWLNFILRNRNKRNTAHHGYDIVVGPIANDKIGLQIRLYESKYIDKKALLQKLKYVKGMTIQYYFGTPRAIEKLTKV